MVKFAIILVFVFTSVSCVGTPPQTSRPRVQPFTVFLEQPDPSTSSLVLLLRVSEPATKESVKSIGESVIEERRREYATITVKSYLEGMTLASTPYVTSKLEGGQITHQFSKIAIEDEKIHTH